ncbi:pantoate--beta-alanine ligase [Pseudolysobacter antarcticus]|uniref:Pantothenate synthetase n=1 Tax=Pseudolysobacter antarcticus TaxID=2511995 RepID=A0A411HKH5_9GAMM|nr:pantoate--beta-alanine ligase [Pseudolysobacter antarcticus]QBB70914.1 pantoate--beta-alanine ligase [Pseudolysobacter antarcticus]
MQIFSQTGELRRYVAEQRKQGQRIAFVPTMGNLHQGHYSLIEIARQHAEVVIATVFVNPTQFGPNEDFNRYPRTLEQDQAGLEQHSCDVLFVPAVDEIYPYGAEHGVRIEVPQLGDILEGACRPGHFVGVATVVTKLFNLVTPDVAVFGQKDYQQLLVIRRLTRDLGLPIEIIAGPTLRESNGLARSSRNQYLIDGQREIAAVIHQSLLSMAENVRSGITDFEKIEAEARRLLENAGLQPDYVVLRASGDLAKPALGQNTDLVGLIAAKLGSTRLIDNILI